MTESFAELFEQSIASQRIRPGTILNGLIVEVGQDYVIVNVGLKSEAVIPADQFKNEKGEIEHWEVEMMSLNHLKSYGWMHTTVKPGDMISCTGGRAKSGAPAMLSSVMKLGDGRTIKS